MQQTLSFLQNDVRVSAAAMFFLFLTTALCSHAQNEISAGLRHNVISKFSDSMLPDIVVKRLRSYGKDSITHLREEYQQNIREDEEEFTMTMHLWFDDDHIVGFIRKAPINNNLKIEIAKIVIDIPVEWCGIIDSSQELHCVKTLQELKAFDSTVKCSHWQQKPDDDDPEFIAFFSKKPAKEDAKKANSKNAKNRRRKKRKEIKQPVAETIATKNGL